MTYRFVLICLCISGSFATMFSENGITLVQAASKKGNKLSKVKLKLVTEHDLAFANDPNGTARVFDIKYSMSGEKVVGLVARNGFLQLFESIPPGRVISTVPLSGMRRVRWLPQDKQIVSVGDTSAVWNFEQRAVQFLEYRHKNAAEGSNCSIMGGPVDVSHDGRIAIGSGSSILLLHATGQPPYLIHEIPSGEVDSLCFSPSGFSIYSCDRNGNLKGWSTTTHRQIFMKRLSKYPDFNLADIGVHKPGERNYGLRMLRQTRRLCYLALQWDYDHKKQIVYDWQFRCLDVHDNQLIDQEVVEEVIHLTLGQGDTVSNETNWQLSPSGAHIAIVDERGRGYLFDAATGQTKASFHREDSIAYYAVDFSPDDMFLATGDEYQLRIWALPESLKSND